MLSGKYERGGQAPQDSHLGGRATSVTQKATHKVTRRLSNAEKQRRWRIAHPERHRAQQKAYRRRRVQAEKAFEAYRRQAEAEERAKEIAAANKALRERQERFSGALRVAAAAGGVEQWFRSLSFEEAEKWADLQGELLKSERVTKEAELAWARGDFPFDPRGNPWVPPKVHVQASQSAPSAEPVSMMETAESRELEREQLRRERCRLETLRAQTQEAQRSRNARRVWCRF